MRSMLMIGVFVLAAGAAQASVPSAEPGGAMARRDAAGRVAGRVWLQDRPRPGSVLPMPDFHRPLLGPHGGLLAAPVRQPAHQPDTGAIAG